MILLAALVIIAEALVILAFRALQNYNSKL